MSRQSFIIGRAGDIKLYDDTVSRRHACLEVEDGVLFLRDLESRNGTYEIRDRHLTPFVAGAVTTDHVFAFGECVRSVAQLLEMARENGAELEELSPAHGATDARVADALDATVIGGIDVVPRPRLGAADIVELLDRIDNDVAAGANLDEACARVGITAQRYARWCNEHGATPAERGAADEDLRRENARLRKLVADLSLEREALREALARHMEKDARATAVPPISLVRDNLK